MPVHPEIWVLANLPCKNIYYRNHSSNTKHDEAVTLTSTRVSTRLTNILNCQNLLFEKAHLLQETYPNEVYEGDPSRLSIQLGTINSITENATLFSTIKKYQNNLLLPVFSLQVCHDDRQRKKEMSENLHKPLFENYLTIQIIAANSS